MAKKATAPAGAREKAGNWLKGALRGVWYTFNMDGNPDVPFIYDEKTIEEAKGHMRALMLLQSTGEIRPLPGATIQSDREFQSFMQRVQHG